jgi:DNA repair protein RecN (Recombination protein N)
MLCQVSEHAERQAPYADPLRSKHRRVAVMMHTGRPEAIKAAARLVDGLNRAGIVAEMPSDDLKIMRSWLAGDSAVALEDSESDTNLSCELVVVLGGDGTILRSAEWAIASDVPLLGVNLGHVGFLAEAESSEIDSIVDRVVHCSYTVEERVTIDVTLRENSTVIWSSFAINEVSIEKAARERMLEVMVEVDGRPLSRWACDGLLVSTPTGSTAYAFSAGGPVIWPGVEALLVVPLSAHALFARPLVLGPRSRVIVELIDTSQTHGVVWADGRRSTELRAGMEIEVTQGRHRLRLARLSESPFTDRGPGPRAARLSIVIDELRITDLGVINEATLALHPGLTVVTGETGAGKTMIVSGMGLLLGARADPKAVRSGAERARVEGRFSAVEYGLVERVTQAGGELDEGELLIARHLTTAGRSRAYLGGAQVPAAVCAEIAEDLITIHGQSEQARLASADRQREILDRFAGDAFAETLDSYRARYSERKTAAAQLEQLRSEALTRTREIDLLRFGLEEIEKVAPEPGEDVSLAAETSRLQSADDLRLSAHAAMVALAGADDESGGALTSIAFARRSVEDLASRDESARELARRVADLSYELGDLAGDLAQYLDGLEVQPGRLEWIAERRSQLFALTRKYGKTCDEVLAWAAESAGRLAGLESSDDKIDELQQRVEALEVELVGLAEEISTRRRQAATAFGPRVRRELEALAMPHAQLIFELTPAEPGPHGADSIDLLFSADVGSEPRSLAKFASGGELSRVRLALEVVLATGRENGTLVFDEIDAGVGGRVAVEIGRRLAELAQHAQVVVVTHLAQVAAFADRHYVVVKSDDGQVTTSGVIQVSDAGRAAELARMMAGLETTDSALAHAGELVELASAARELLR